MAGSRKHCVAVAGLQFDVYASSYFFRGGQRVVSVAARRNFHCSKKSLFLLWVVDQSFGGRTRRRLERTVVYTVDEFEYTKHLSKKIDLCTRV